MARSPEASARQFLMASASELGLRDDLSDLKLDSVVPTPVGFSVRFQQMSNGLPVEGANLVLTMNRSFQVLTYVSDYARSANGYGLEKFSSQNFQVSEQNALNRAYEILKLTASPTLQTIEKKMMMEAGSLRSVYVIQLAAPVDHLYAWEMVMDAVDGRIYRSRDLAVHSHKEGTVVTTQVFDPNPTIKSGKTAQGLDANNGSNTFFESMMTEVKLDNLIKKNGKFVLAGPNVVISDSESPKNPDCTFATESFKVKRSDACFDAVNVYYFIDKTMKYMNGTLGFKAHPIKYQGGIKADPHGLNGEDNSHYSPLADELAFGEGGIDDAQDSDVIIHELGHALHNWVTNGHLSQVEGLSEGSGDYWAASYDRQFMKPGNIAYDWTFSFDGHNEFWPGRSVKVAGKYPAAAQGEIHSAGQLWATVCMEVYDAIGKEKADKLFWTALSSLNESSSQLDAAKAYVVAAQQLFPADLETVIKKFKARGYSVN